MGFLFLVCVIEQEAEWCDRTEGSVFELHHAGYTQGKGFEERAGFFDGGDVEEKYWAADVCLYIPLFELAGEVDPDGGGNFFDHYGASCGQVVCFFCPATDGEDFCCGC